MKRTGHELTLPAPGSPVAGVQLAARRGLWRFLAFLLVSLCAWPLRHDSPASLLPATLADWLGAPPPLALLDLAFGIYCVSALLLLPGRLAASTDRGWLQLLYRSAFYPLYLGTAALDLRFALVLGAGTALYLCEQFLTHAGIWRETGPRASQDGNRR